MDQQTGKITERYGYNKDVPRRLWRVQFQGTSLQARTMPSFTSRQDFKDKTVAHLNWRSREPSPFVSTFDNETHAWNWARKIQQCNQGEEFVIHEIRSSRLGAVFGVSRMVQRFRLRPGIKESMYQDEYLVLDEISERSIVSSEPSKGYVFDDEYDDDDDDYYYLDDIDHLFEGIRI